MDFDPFPQPTTSGPGAYASVWRPVQLAMARRVRVEPLTPTPRFVAGADCAFSRDGRSIHAVALVWDRQERRVVEIVRLTRPLCAPYIGGYLSFREGPALFEAIQMLRHPFGVIAFDGQGLAHPRRCGLASHLGVALKMPTVGVAKSRLIGTHVDPPSEAGSHVPLMGADEQIGVVLRTRDKVRPLYVSVGHRVDLPSAVDIVRACVTRYRLPEPTRLADAEVAKLKASSKD